MTHLLQDSSIHEHPDEGWGVREDFSNVLDITLETEESEWECLGVDVNDFTLSLGQRK